MSTTIETLLTRNLFEVFGEADPIKRRAVIGEIWAEDGVFVDPHGRHIGHDAIDKAVASLHAALPNYVFHEIASAQALVGAGRIGWSHGPVGEPPKVTGEDIAIVRNGRIVELFAFIDNVPQP